MRRVRGARWLERCERYAELQQQGMSAKEIAKQAGRPHHSVSRDLRLARELTPEQKEAARAGELTYTAAEASLPPSYFDRVNDFAIITYSPPSPGDDPRVALVDEVLRRLAPDPPPTASELRFQVLASEKADLYDVETVTLEPEVSCTCRYWRMFQVECQHIQAARRYYQEWQGEQETEQHG